MLLVTVVLLAASATWTFSDVEGVGLRLAHEPRSCDGADVELTGTWVASGAWWRALFRPSDSFRPLIFLPSSAYPTDGCVSWRASRSTIEIGSCVGLRVWIPYRLEGDVLYLRGIRYVRTRRARAIAATSGT